MTAPRVPPSESKLHVGTDLSSRDDQKHVVSASLTSADGVDGAGTDLSSRDDQKHIVSASLTSADGVDAYGAETDLSSPEDRQIDHPRLDSDRVSTMSTMWTESLGFYDLVFDVSCLRKLHQGWRVLSRSESSLSIDSEPAPTATLQPQQSTDVRTFGVFGKQSCGKTWFLQRFLALPNIDVTRVIPTRTC